MELKINRETVPAAECIYEAVQEQGIELDYILPDYYPDIFRLVRCEVLPVVADCSVSGGRLSYELRCDIRILYCGEDGSAMRCVSQRQTFSKTAELGADCENPEIRVVPKSDHISYRAVNKRRLDVRGAVSVNIRVTGEKSQEVVSDAFGMNVQLKKIPVRYAAKKLCADKPIQLSEETEISEAQPPVLGIISCRCTAPECELKMISGKLLAKGEADVKLLYSCEKDGEGAVEPLSFSLPYSQIIDIDGADDTFTCTVVPEVVSCDVTPSAGRNGDNRTLKCDIELKLLCRAVKVASAMLCTDVYSTVYPCEAVVSDIRAEQAANDCTESFRHSAKIAEGDDVPQTIYAMWCTPKNINSRRGDDGRTVVISGMLTYSMAAKDKSGMIVMPDRDEAFEETIALPEGMGNCTVTAQIIPGDVSYNISAEGALTVRTDITAKLSLSDCGIISAVTDIIIDDSVKKQRDGDYAVKLYYGSADEDVWDIAKRYSTSAQAVMEENDLGSETLSDGGMLLIPIVT